MPGSWLRSTVSRGPSSRSTGIEHVRGAPASGPRPGDPRVPTASLVTAAVGAGRSRHVPFTTPRGPVRPRPRDLTFSTCRIESRAAAGRPGRPVGGRQFVGIPAPRVGASTRRLRSGSSRSTIASRASPRACVCSGVSGPNTASRTASTCPGATDRTTSQPASVRTARLPRPSSGDGSRRTQPRSSSRATVCESRLCDWLDRRARSLIRRLRVGDSDSIARTTYAAWLMPASRWSWASRTRGTSPRP